VAIEAGAKSAGYDLISIDENQDWPNNTIQQSVSSMIAESDCIIADVSGHDPNVFFELGLAAAMGKGIFLIANKGGGRIAPFDIYNFEILIYEENADGYISLTMKIESSLIEFRKFPLSRQFLWGPKLSAPFYVDWDSLNVRDAENLCKELLSQLGFRRLDWGKGSREIDLIAELPKKDPDGFEYREQWLISMGLNAPIEMFIDMASHDPEFFLHRLLKYSDRFEETISREYETSITLLLILFKKGSSLEKLEMMRERIEKRRFNKPYGWNMRLRIWDQDYLTSLVHRFSSIGYKYFSDEGRIRSKTRKSYEDLYSENAKFVERQASLIRDLEDEKNKRIRAERDSIWKDISFSAAHKIGNPIFAIETDLDPLLKRINEQRKNEAVEVVSNIRSSVEKAKSVVEQFKSLARAQEIKPVSTLLKPILDDACKTAVNQGVNCTVQCASDVEVIGDPVRLAECFDELVINATYWFGKKEKRIWIEVFSPAPDPLPDFLDSTQAYVLTHVKDNGCGIQPKEKNGIFDAFYTKREHGTGLGLALVRRIIDGHKGGIIEVGSPKKGADFEVFLPLSPIELSRSQNIKTVRKKVKPKGM
jgi:signal transduction histidine kinase